MGSTFKLDAALNPEQQALLRSALASNKQTPVNSVGDLPNTPTPSSTMANGKSNGSVSAARSSIDAAKAYPSPDDLQQPINGGRFDEGPLLDFGLEDGNFDWDNNDDSLNFIDNNQPDGDYNEHDDKRKHPDEDDDDQEGSHKRLESEDKASRKPGRKPLTGEPTTKRKAQNRAAQRAFRERKERHLKDLETKVDELEKVSESTNHENGRLRAEVERLNIEVKEYRKRLSLSGPGARTSPTALSQGRLEPTGLNEFQFNFPKFGDLPGSSFINGGSLAKTSTPVRTPSDPQRSSSGSVSVVNRNMTSNTNGASGPSPRTMTDASFTKSPEMQNFQSPVSSEGVDSLSGLFSPSILESARRSASLDYMGNRQMPSQPLKMKKESTDSSRGYSQTLNFNPGSTGSPSASSMSHGGVNSSCDTTPEPSHGESPNRKQSEGIPYASNEIQSQGIQAPTSFLPSIPSATSPTTASIYSPIDFNSLAAQNNNAFDPVLFSDYRDPQDSILNSTTFPASTSNTFTDFFSDPYLLNPNDFESPFNTGVTLDGQPDSLQPRTMASQIPPNVDSSGKKMDLMQRVDEAQDVNHEPVSGGALKKDEVEKGIGRKVEKPTFVSCDKLWDRVQTSALARSGEIDMDDLCAQLKSKARCSGNGAVIDQADVDKILGPPPGSEDYGFLSMPKGRK